MEGRASNKPIVLIPLDEARRKCDEEHSSITRVKWVEHISLWPRFIGRMKEGVEYELDKYLMKYSDRLQGVPLAYERWQFVQKLGTIEGDSPFINFDVRVDLIIFKPTIGNTLVGVVNKMDFTSDRIGCLVHGIFNASIDYPNICSMGELELDSEFEFRVIGMEDGEYGIIVIYGSIDDGCRKIKI